MFEIANMCNLVVFRRCGFSVIKLLFEPQKSHGKRTLPTLVQLNFVTVLGKHAAFPVLQLANAADVCFCRQELELSPLIIH